MLSYLVTSQTRRKLLSILWGSGQSGSVRDLASDTGMAYAVTHRELHAMWEAGLASRRLDGNRTVFSANHGHPRAELLTSLVRTETDASPEAPSPGERAVLDSISALGAPLVVSPTPASVESDDAPLVPPEVAIVEGALLARRDATVARALPVALHHVREELDLELLLREAKRRGALHAVGMFIELTGSLGASERLRHAADRFRDRRRTRVQDFFLAATSPLQRRLAELNTPEVARRWGFRMNLGLDAFEATFRRFCGEDTG